MLCAWASLHVARGDLLHSWLSPLADKRNDEWGGVFGLDYIDVSSGVMSAKIRTPTSPGYSAPIAERLGRETGIVVRTVGMITTAKQAEAIVAEGTADMVALARAFLDNPHPARCNTSAPPQTYGRARLCRTELTGLDDRAVSSRRFDSRPRVIYFTQHVRRVP